MSLSLSARTARMLAFSNAIDASGGGAVHLYGSNQPDSPEIAAFDAPLAIVALAVPCGGVDVSDEGLVRLTLTHVSGVAAQAGVARWGRIVDGAGNALYDAPAGLPEAALPFVVTDGRPTPSAQFYAGGAVNIVSAVWLE